MALSNLAQWNKDEKKAPTACGAACGASDKPADKPASCGTACGAGDKPTEKPTENRRPVERLAGRGTRNNFIHREKGRL